MSIENDIFSILKFFSYAHLPEALQEVSKQFHSIANSMVFVSGDLERFEKKGGTLRNINAETLAGLRKLLESKDCFVRASIAQD